MKFYWVRWMEKSWSDEAKVLVDVGMSPWRLCSKSAEGGYWNIADRDVTVAEVGPEDEIIEVDVPEPRGGP